MIKKEFETAYKSPIRLTHNLAEYTINKKTSFFRKLENLCTDIYEFQNLTIPNPPQVNQVGIRPLNP